jgi:hypothetical protein
MVNEALVLKTVTHMLRHPENWDQSSYESPSDDKCGTHRCFAGWGISIVHDFPISIYSSLTYSDRLRKLEELGISTIDPNTGNQYKSFMLRDAHVYARLLFGLTHDQAHRLFHDTTADMQAFLESVQKTTGIDLGVR